MFTLQFRLFPKYGASCAFGSNEWSCVPGHVEDTALTPIQSTMVTHFKSLDSNPDGTRREQVLGFWTQGKQPHKGQLGAKIWQLRP